MSNSLIVAIEFGIKVKWQGNDRYLSNTNIREGVKYLMNGEGLFVCKYQPAHLPHNSPKAASVETESAQSLRTICRNPTGRR